MKQVRGEPANAPPADGKLTERFSRRRFLVSLGLVAGAGAAGTLSWRARAGGAHRIEASRAGLGTWIRIVARHEDPARAERAISRAFRAIDQVDSQMSIHRSDSELARVNHAAGERAVAVSASLLDVVARARDCSVATGRVYDPTVLPLMRLFGFYDSGRTHMPSDRDISTTLDAMGPHVVAIDRVAGTLGLTRRRAGLDLGAIGKGWAVDRAVDALRAEGVTSGLVDVGRNVYGLGTPDEESAGWRVGVLHPTTGEVDRVFTLHDTAVATSGNYEQWETLDGVRVGHVLDALHGRPANPHLSATVHARSGFDSDNASSIAFLVGRRVTAIVPGVLDVHFIG